LLKVWYRLKRDYYANLSRDLIESSLDAEEKGNLDLASIYYEESTKAYLKYFEMCEKIK